MSKLQKKSDAIPHEFRTQILFEWIPNAKVSMANPEFKLLWDAYFIYIDPNGIKKTDCPICLNNVLTSWKSMQKFLIESEQQYNALDQL